MSCKHINYIQKKRPMDVFLNNGIPKGQTVLWRGAGRSPVINAQPRKNYIFSRNFFITSMCFCTAAGAGPPGKLRELTQASSEMAAYTSSSNSSENSSSWGEGELVYSQAVLLTVQDKFANHGVRVAEGHAFFDKVVRRVRGVGESQARAGIQLLGVKLTPF